MYLDSRDPVMAVSSAGFDLLALDPSLQWIIAENALADWCPDNAGSHRRCLGMLSNRNRTSSFRFAIGHDPTSNTLLIAFHLSFKPRPSTSAKPKHVFVIIPTERSGVEDSGDILNSAVINTDDVDEATLEQLRQAGLVGSVARGPQRISKIQLRLESPGYAIMPQATIGKAIEGTPLELLQNLRSLCEAKCLDAYVGFDVQTHGRIERVQQILQQGTPSMPTINIESMYNGLGAMNVWHQYGLRDDHKTRTHQPPAMGREHSPPPPPYPDTAPGPGVPPSSPQFPQPMPASQATEVLSTPEWLPSIPAILVPCSETDSPDLRPSSCETSYPRDTSVASDTPMPEPLSRKRRATSDPPSDGHLSERSYSSGTISAETPGLMCDFARWLDWAWSWLPEAHERLRDQMLALGRAARAGDVAAFEDIRADCSSRLMFLVADDKDAADRALTREHVTDAETPASRGRDFQAEVRMVVRYTNGINGEADRLLDTALFQLARTARCGGQERAFELRKAMFVARACVMLQDMAKSKR